MTTAVTCLGCGCACDDIDLVITNNRIVESRRACELGARWFGDGSVPTRTMVAGRDAARDETLAAIVRLLQNAQAPLVYLAPELSCEAQGEAVGLADVLRADLDTVTSSTAMRSILAAQERGCASATLGEIRNRADVVVFWGVDPATAYPRYAERYAPEPIGIHVPGGRRGRVVIAVDVGTARGPADADHRVTLAPGDEVSTLTALRAGQGELAAMLRRGRYVAIVADAEPSAAVADTVDPGRSAALIALTQSLNEHTRCALSTLRAGGNRSGADACLTWQTGFPVAVEFARGVPRYRPYDAGAAALQNGTIDTVLVLGAAAQVPASVTALLAGVQTAVVGPRASEVSWPAVAVMDTAVAGIHEAGTALRMDDVPLPLGAVISGPPPARTIIRELRLRLGAPAA